MLQGVVHAPKRTQLHRDCREKARRPISVRVFCASLSGAVALVGERLCLCSNVMFGFASIFRKWVDDIFPDNEITLYEAFLI